VSTARVEIGLHFGSEKEGTSGTPVGRSAWFRSCWWGKRGNYYDFRDGGGGEKVRKRSEESKKKKTEESSMLKLRKGARVQ